MILVKGALKKMDSFTSTFITLLIIFLGVGLVAAIIGLFLFNNFDWWDKW